ncbi:MAG: hypothetical protein CMB73_07590 [Euryarchaeota archaeon]|nr:hypothetical protein [Euryarchaeota archaeon]
MFEKKKNKPITITFVMILTMLLAPLTGFASATNTYTSIEDYCDLEIQDAQGLTYNPNFINQVSTDFVIVEVDPGMYYLEMSCQSGLTSGDITFTTYGKSQDGITTKVPSTVFSGYSSTEPALTPLSIESDATGSNGFIAYVEVKLDGQDISGNDILVENKIVLVPMIDTENDTTPRISFWSGKVNQHNMNGVWTTDSDGTSGGGLQANWGSEGWADRKVEYCQKFFPNTVAVEMREFVEKITFLNRGNTGPSVSYKPVYDCIQESDNDTNNDSVDLRLDCEEGLDHDYQQFFSNDFSTIISYTGAFANEITAHPAWSADIPGAEWVWNTSDGYGFAGGVQFEHELLIPQNAVEFAGLVTVAADNSYEVTLNGDFIGEEIDEYNFMNSHVEEYLLDSSLTQGTNVLEFGVENWHNIGGLLYSGVFEYCLEDRTNDNNTGDDNNTGGNTTDGNNTGGNTTIDNGCGQPPYCNGTIIYAMINEQYGTYDHKATIKTGTLVSGSDYVLDWEIADSSQNIISSGSDVWTATQSTRYSYDTGLSLGYDTYCVSASLYEDGTLVDTGNGCITVENETAEIVYAVISEQYGTFDHRITIKTANLVNTIGYTLDWELVDDNQNIVSSGTDVWTATQPTAYSYDTNLDLEPGVHCVTAWLYEVGTLVDTQNSCITIENSTQPAEIIYAIVNEQYGTFDHKVTIKSGSLQAGESYELDWELVDDNQNVISSGTDSWTATQSTRYTYDTNLDLGEGTFCVTAWLYEDGVLIDTANGCITIECDQNNSGGSSGGNSSGNGTDTGSGNGSDTGSGNGTIGNGSGDGGTGNNSGNGTNGNGSDGGSGNGTGGESGDGKVDDWNDNLNEMPDEEVVEEVVEEKDLSVIGETINGIIDAIANFFDNLFGDSKDADDTSDLKADVETEKEVWE